MGGVAERRYVALLAAAFAIVWLGLAIEPRHRADWALENVLTAIAVALLALTRRRVPLSRLSYTLIFLFLTLHAVGAHYTYSEVPYDAWFTALTGKSLNEALGWQRNNFDRFVHFIYGLLLTQSVREAFVRATAEVVHEKQRNPAPQPGVLVAESEHEGDEHEPHRAVGETRQRPPH